MKKDDVEFKNKKKYSKPTLEIAEFRFSEHIAVSPSGCYWGGYFTHALPGCNSTPSTDGSWIDNTGP